MPPSLERTKKTGEDTELPLSPVNTATLAGDVCPPKLSDTEQQITQDGIAKFSRLGWKRLTILLVVEAIAIGALSLPAAFATLGMVVGVLLNVIIGFIAIYTGYLVGKVKLLHPEVRHYGDVGRLLLGRTGYEVLSFMLILQLLFLAASHCLTGATAFSNITDNATCSVVFSIVSAILMYLLSIPPSFAEVAILGYIDFASIILAIGITIIATGIQRNDHHSNQIDVQWSAGPKADLSFTECFTAVLNIIFAYGFTTCQFSFMDEMHTPADYMKSIWSLGLIEISIYTLTGALIYAFVGPNVEAPALLSAGPLISKIAFGVAIPVIFISGAILVTTAGRAIHGRIYANEITRFINTTKGWTTWLLVILALVIVGWVIAEAIPFFSDLVALISALLNSGFTFYFPAVMWFVLLRTGEWNSWRNLGLGALNVFIFCLGIFCLVGGTYASVQSIIDQYQQGFAGKPFGCK
ncbi:hypothetical protein ASPVEDRAFT_53836 [Aspergillus versicolor CBS 583.65]|uniref:Amino acid transporter transmembrane domain-containing protein n=1 Tax=Aspergillus versicolor CBS 583.65 TaxID=1036611 RepID=A0A1L9PPJ0_ASPVE|nr:uncharacterized protein ASPVEDRAFT_53836 [Aspergillus versicolor CBS 583.65]OJJ03413.1 hypothetical protein ASPVEDRAFT_53836 [Aspergillus versicolor CBS 583.65]